MIGSGAGMLISVPFTLFLSVIEIIVAFIQAYIFTILTASYIGAATEDHH
jgi:F-type H+-transporting ATPase subunit a